jgi:hypothetical protein
MQDSKKNLYSLYQQLTDNDMDYDEYISLCWSDQTINASCDTELPECNMRSSVSNLHKLKIPYYKQCVL